MMFGVAFFLMLLAASQVQAKSGYILTAPKVFLAGEHEKICLSFHNIDREVEVELWISTVNTLERQSSETDVLDGGKGGCIDLLVPNNIQESEVWFNVSGQTTDGSYAFADGQKVTITKTSIITFIQTDKPIYKPGQLVYFRILSMTSKLKPLNDVVKKVYLETPTGIKMKQWIKQDLTPDYGKTTKSGLISLDFRLAADTVLGAWKIIAEVEGGKEEQTFKVEEYVLPKFEVKITPQPFIMVNARDINLTVCATYTYGKAVEGMLKLNVCVTDTFSMYGRRRPSGPPERPCYIERVPINGCKRFHIDADSIHLRFSNYTLWNSKLRIEAEVNETGTGVILNGNHEHDLERDRLKLAFTSPDYFKPGLIYYGRLTVKNPDDTPAAGEEINLKWTDRISITFHTDSDGVINFTLPNMPTITNYVRLSAIATQHKEDYLRRNPIHNLYTPSSSISLKAWYSPSGRFIQIASFIGTAPCGEPINLDVTFTTEGNRPITFHYQVLTLGNIVLTGVKEHVASGSPSVERTTAAPPPPDGSEPGTQGTDGDTPGWVSPTTTTVTPPLPFVDKFTLKLGITTAMSPKARILVYYITDQGETVADSIEIDVAECLQNNVKMSFKENKIEPGKPTVLSLTADPDSVCAVAVVDKSVHLLGGNGQLQISKVFALLDRYDIKSNPFHNPFVGDPYCRGKLSGTKGRYPGPYEYYSNFYDSEQAFTRIGMVVLSDFEVASRPCDQRPLPMMMSGPRGGGPPVSGSAATGQAVEVRNYFPETWLWDLQFIGASGTFEVQRYLPHSITEWVGSTFCTNEKSGFGVSKMAKITTFKPFFVSFTLPYSVDRNEKVRLPVTIFNYLKDCLAVELTMGEPPAYDVTDEAQRKVCVCGGQSRTEYFHIVMKQIGQINVTVSAVSVGDSLGICRNPNEVMSTQVGYRDAVSRHLLVEPEGKEMEYSYSEFFCLKTNNPETATANLSLSDANLVPDSAKGEVSVIGDVMGPTLSGLERLLRMPMGCGEQNMLLFVPNIYVLQYLNNTKQLTPSVEVRAKNFMEKGYQRELTYRHSDGSYSAFGNRDPEGSTWLTGFVLKSFAQAKRYIFIDEEDLTKSINWFRQKQLPSGCFPQIGKVLHSDMKGGLSSGGSPATLTTYILIALLEAEIPDTDTMVVGALRCIESASPSDNYTIALMAFAYSLWKPLNITTKNMIAKLDARAESSDGMKHWTKGAYTTTPPPPRQGGIIHPYHKATSADVEMTAYALMAILTQPEGITKGLPIVKWLSSQRSAHGGFKSTQDTVVALQALAQYASKTYSDKLQATVTVTGQDIKKTFVLDADNRLVLQHADVLVPNTLAIEARGTGCFFVQANVKYNIFAAASPADGAFQLTVTPSTAGNNCKERSIRICVRYNGPGASNMAVVEVKMVSGWVANKKSIEELITDNSVQLKKFEIQQKMVNFYFDELTNSQKCFAFTVTQEVEVLNAKASIVKVYDYYENDKSVSSSYELLPCQ